MTTTTPTVADEIERYLRTGDTDPYHAAWSAPSFLEGARGAGADLENALVAEVSRRANGWQPPPALVAIENLLAFTRAKVEPMVHGSYRVRSRTRCWRWSRGRSCSSRRATSRRCFARRGGRVRHGTWPTSNSAPSALTCSPTMPRRFSA